MGAVAGHSHMADLPRQLFLAYFSFFLPVAFLRWFYLFLCLFLGPMGVYFFLEKTVFSKSKEKSLFAFLGALFYLLNLGTLQHFYVPFEMFLTQYAALGWLFLFTTRYLEKPNKKTLVWFSLVTFLSTAQAYAATLWYAFFGCFILYLLVWLIINRFRALKPVFWLLGTTLAVNAFWLLPNLYYIFQHSGEVLGAKINQLFSQEAFYHNYEYGHLQNAAVLKNHLFSWTQFNFATNKFEPLLKTWLSYLNNPFIMTLGYLFSFLIFFGLIMILLKKRKALYPLLPVFFLSLFFLISATWPLSLIFSFLRSRSSLFAEALRFPFTKFSLILMFVYAVFFAWGLWVLKEILWKFFRRKKMVLTLIFLLPTFALFFFAKPAFQGELIDQKMKVKIPNQYFTAFDWFNQQENGRILQLPLHSLWGWEYRDWDFQGAGFAWFGLKQPFLARDFDRWSLNNEKAYQELSYALYAQNQLLFEELLAKYQIKYLLVDQSLIDPEHTKKVLFLKETEKLFSLSSKIKPEKEFGFLKIYRFENKQALNQSYPEIFDFTNPPQGLKDQAQKEALAYGQINFDDFWLKQPISYKFDLKKLNPQPALCGPSQEKQVFGLRLEKEGFTLFGEKAIVCTKIPLKEILVKRPAQSFLLKVSFAGEKARLCLGKRGTDDCLGSKKEEDAVYFLFPPNREIKDYELRFLLDSQDEKKEVLIKDIQISVLSAKKQLSPIAVDNLEIQEPLKYSSFKEEKRDTFSYQELLHNQSYLLLVEAENESGLPLRLCLTNYTSERCDLYDNLKDGQNIFFIPPMDKDGQGYDVNLSNYAIGPVRSVNLLKSIKIIPWEDEFLKYQENPEGEYLNNNQSFEKNWRAYEYLGGLRVKSLGKPVLINGWENGWLIKERTEGPIIFFFLPQILQYLGFFFVLVLIVLLIVF